MIYATPRKDDSFTLSVKISLQPSSYKTYGLFVETLTEKQAFGLLPQAKTASMNLKQEEF